jgi:hypothetical protein
LSGFGIAGNILYIIEFGLRALLDKVFNQNFVTCFVKDQVKFSLYGWSNGGTTIWFGSLATPRISKRNTTRMGSRRSCLSSTPVF